MKNLRSLIVITALFFVSINMYAQNIEQRVFGNDDGFFVIINNKAQFYEYAWESDSYDHNSKCDFTLPNGYKSVYGFKDFLAVIINNKVQMYEFNGTSWVTFPRLPELPLPNGYGKVFSGQEKGAVCVIVNNKVQIYSYNGRIWGTLAAADFTLPNAYKHIFGGADSFGVVVGNKAQFYEFKGGKWAADSRLDLTLPNGYRYVFGSKDAFMKWNKAYVVFDDRVQIYTFDNYDNKWETDSDWVFVIPKK